MTVTKEPHLIKVRRLGADVDDSVKRIINMAVRGYNLDDAVAALRENVEAFIDVAANPPAKV